MPLDESPEAQRLRELKSARGHVAHFERLVEQYAHRRDHGDQVPSVEILSRWIEQAEEELRSWRERVRRLEMPTAPPLA